MTGLTKRRNISTLIDNKSAFNSDDVQLCVYDTYQKCQQIPFHAEQLMFCAMFEGKKVMHHSSLQRGQDFLPGQSFIIGRGEQVKIDFQKPKKKVPLAA